MPKHIKEITPKDIFFGDTIRHGTGAGIFSVVLTTEGNLIRIVDINGNIKIIDFYKDLVDQVWRPSNKIWEKELQSQRKKPPDLSLKEQGHAVGSKQFILSQRLIRIKELEDGGPGRPKSIKQLKNLNKELLKALSHLIGKSNTEETRKEAIDIILNKLKKCNKRINKYTNFKGIFYVNGSFNRTSFKRKLKYYC